MRRLVLSLLFAATLLAPSLAAQQPGKAPSIAFATAGEGRKILTARDDFVTRLSAFDRASRLQTGNDVSEQEYLSFVAKNVLDWAPQEKAAVQAAFDSLVPSLEKFSLPFPDTVLFIKTTGAEEGNTEYTRANAIILPQSALARRASLKGMIAHELFHVLSRNAPSLRDQAYAVIGFQPCGEIPFPTSLASRKITDPDAPLNNHCIRVQAGPESVWVVPILFSKSPRYDAAKGGLFFNYLEMKLLVVQRTPGGQASYDVLNPRLLDLNEVQGFFEQVGRNTDYILHPEEILADNFEFLLIGKTDLPSPEIQRNLAAVLSSR